MLDLLRGRVLIRPIIDERDGHIIIPDDVRDKRDTRNSLGRGIVVAMGPPALTPIRKKRCSCDGGKCRWCSGTGVDAVDAIPNCERCESRGVCALCNGAGWVTRGGVEIPHHFAIGDQVVHVGQHKSRDVIWNGERLRACSQEEVQAVISP